MTTGYFDASCPSCFKRFGWHGGIMDCPPCPRCNHQIDRETLEHDQKVMDEFREFLSEHPMSTKGRTMRVRMRRAAGLSRGQAAKGLGITLSELDAMENEQADPLPTLNARMIDFYGLDPESFNKE